MSQNKVTVAPLDGRPAWTGKEPFSFDWYEACNRAFLSEMRKYYPERELRPQWPHHELTHKSPRRSLGGRGCFGDV
jgi:hypothetical protein